MVKVVANILQFTWCYTILSTKHVGMHISYFGDDDEDLLGVYFSAGLVGAFRFQRLLYKLTLLDFYITIQLQLYLSFLFMISFWFFSLACFILYLYQHQQRPAIHPRVNHVLFNQTHFIRSIFQLCISDKIDLMKKQSLRKKL